MKNPGPNDFSEMKSSLDLWKDAFTSTFKQLVDKGKEFQQVTEQFFVPRMVRDFPRMDMVEGDREIYVVFELPGLTKEDFKIEIGGGFLHLVGEKKNPLQKKAVGIHLSECSYGHFERVVLLPVKIIEEKIDAEFTSGVLTVTLPKAELQDLPKSPIKVR